MATTATDTENYPQPERKPKKTLLDKLNGWCDKRLPPLTVSKEYLMPSLIVLAGAVFLCAVLAFIDFIAALGGILTWFALLIFMAAFLTDMWLLIFFKSKSKGYKIFYFVLVGLTAAFWFFSAFFF